MNKRKLSILSAILAAAVLSLFAVAAYASPQLIMINVTTTTDEFNYSGSGTGCSLREAINTANNGAPFGGCAAIGTGKPYIHVPEGTYKMTLLGEDGDTGVNAYGDFDVMTDMTIHGVGRGLTFIDAQGHNRIFDLDLATRVELNSMTLRNGDAGTSVGGAIRARGYEAHLIYLIVDNNKSKNAAIYNKNGDMSLYRMVVQNNDNGATAGVGAGGIYSEGVLTIDQSLIYNNSGGFGGGIDTENSTIITNSTISGNKAGYRGGGIEVYNDTHFILVDLSNVTITGNHANIGAQYNGGGVGGVSNTLNGAIHVRNSIIAGNVDEGFNTANSDYVANDCWGDFISDGYNLIGKNYNCSGFTNGVSGDKVGTQAQPLDPKLAALANNGGWTKTHALLHGSPAVDAGNYQGCKDRNGALLTTDQRGFARPVEGDGSGGAWCDMGAHEAASGGFPTPTPTTQSCNTKPAAPTLNTPTNGGTVTLRHVALDWDGVTCATKYKVLVKQDSTSGLKADKHVVYSSSYITVQLKRQHEYFWRVKACDALGCTKSVWFSFTLVKK